MVNGKTNFDIVVLFFLTIRCKFRRFVAGKLLKSTVNWLQHSKKPLDIKTLGTIEQKVTQKFGGFGFDSLGSGPFLSFIQKKEIQCYLGKSILVSTEEENELHELLIIKDDIKLFVEQCGDENSHPRVRLFRIIHCHYGYLRHPSLSLITSPFVSLLSTIISPCTISMLFLPVSAIIHYNYYHLHRHFHHHCH